MFKKSVFTDPFVLIAAGAAVVIAVGSAAYYVVESKTPVAQVQVSPTSTAIIATGTVEPAQSPDLAFQSGGRVARISVAVGNSVSKGQLLASLDVASLSAQRAQAAANLKSQQAKLDEMQAGPRAVDVSAKQTAISQAQLSLANMYQTITNSLSDSFGKSSAAIQTNTDSLFNNPNSSAPTLVFTSANSENTNVLVNQRVAITAIIGQWQQEASSLSAQAPAADVEAALGSSIARLKAMRDFSNAVSNALGSAIPTSAFTQTSINAALASANALRDTLSTLISTLQTEGQTLAADKLAVQSAQDALNQVNAGATAQDIQAQQAQVEAAQASVANIDAQIGSSEVIAPFSGTVASVHIKQGAIVAPNTVAISLNPSSALQITAYVSEADASKIASGQSADVTLDAYGAGRHFDATVVNVDRSPTMQNGVPAYKVTLQFSQNDPSISSGMTANVTFNQ